MKTTIEQTPNPFVRAWSVHIQTAATPSGKRPKHPYPTVTITYRVGRTVAEPEREECAPWEFATAVGAAYELSELIRILDEEVAEWFVHRDAEDGFVVDAHAPIDDSALYRIHKSPPCPNLHDAVLEVLLLVREGRGQPKPTRMGDLDAAGKMK